VRRLATALAGGKVLEDWLAESQVTKHSAVVALAF
jgi:hypothetical protein